MARSCLHLLIVIMLIAFTLLGTSLSIPLSRTRQLLQTKEDALASNNIMNHQQTMEKMKEIEHDELTKGRMDVQLTDYSPTGPNPYHTPNPPLRG